MVKKLSTLHNLIVNKVAGEPQTTQLIDIRLE